MKKKIILFVILCICVGVATVSCKKEPANNGNEQTSQTSTMPAENTAEDVTPSVTEGPAPTTADVKEKIEFVHNPNMQCEWTGNYVRSGNGEQKKATLNIAMSDVSSFQFDLEVDTSKIGGFPTIDGNLAKYPEEGGNYVEFMYTDEFVYVNRVILSGDKDLEKIYSGKFYPVKD